MNFIPILDDALNVIRTKDSYDDFDSMIALGKVAEITKYDLDKLPSMTGEEYKKLFMILTHLLMIEFTPDEDYNNRIAAVAFYSAYRCLDVEYESGVSLYDDVYSKTNNLLYIFGHKYLANVLSNAKDSNASPYNPLSFLNSSNSDEEIYLMEYVQLSNNPRITTSEAFFLERYKNLKYNIISNLDTSRDLGSLLRENQDILFDYISDKIGKNEYDF